jgi:hypothetical protein
MPEHNQKMAQNPETPRPLPLWAYVEMVQRMDGADESADSAVCTLQTVKVFSTFPDSIWIPDSGFLNFLVFTDEFLEFLVFSFYSFLVNVYCFSLF